MSTIVKDNDYKLFDVNEKKYVYIADTGKIFEADNELVDVLEELRIQGKSMDEFASEHQDQSNIQKVVELVKSENIFGDNKEKKESLIKKRIEKNTIGAIALLLIQGCNLRCTYCYGEDGQYHDSGIMDVSTALRSVAFFVKESSLQSINICFFGGEPLLNFPVIKEVAEYCKQLESDTGKTISFSMTTNGTLITEEIEKFILGNKVAVQISLDGDKETQDKNRFDAQHNGTYETVVNKTKNLRERGALGVRATLTPFNMNVVEIYKHLESLNFNKIIISPAFNLLSDEDYTVLAEKYIEWYRHLETELKNGNFKYVRKAKLFRQEIQKIDRALVRISSCGAGKNMVAVDIHGNVFPCQRFVAMKEYGIGSINDGLSAQKTFLADVVGGESNKCKECWIRNLCVSGCPFCNASDNGDVHIQNEKCCEYEKAVHEELIKIYLRLTEKEKQMLIG